MSTSTSTPKTPRGVLPVEVDGVPIIYIGKKKTYETPVRGPAIVVAEGKITMRDDFDSKIATARLWVITAFYDSTEVKAYSIRTTRWFSGKLRWRITQRVKARIRRAVRQVT